MFKVLGLTVGDMGGVAVVAPSGVLSCGVLCSGEMWCGGVDRVRVRVRVISSSAK